MANSISRLALFKRSNGIWYISYFQDGKQRIKSTGANLKTDALKVLKDFETYLHKKPTSILFTDFVKQFLTVQATSLREGTLERIYKPTFKTFLNIIGNKLLSEYTLKDVETYKAKRLETCKAVTVNIEFRALRAAFNLAIKWQLAKSNPFLLSSQVKTAEKLPSYLSKQEFQKLLSVVSEQVLKDIYIFAVLTGLRLSEILNLRWQDVDLQRKTITVGSEAFQTKSGRVRVIPMSEDIYKLLLRRSTSTKSIDSTKSIEQAYVFHRNGYKLLNDYVSKKFKSYCRLIGLSEAIHFHSLRHTAATWLVQSGANIYQVGKLLGHSSVKVTEIYSHLAASELQEVVNMVALN